jgi:hypothetical protein
VAEAEAAEAFAQARDPYGRGSLEELRPEFFGFLM